jgi:hypothetical protein
MNLNVRPQPMYDPRTQQPVKELAKPRTTRIVFASLSEISFPAGKEDQGLYDTQRYLRDLASKNAADDVKTMAQGEAEAAKSKDGTGLVNLGYAYVSVGQFLAGAYPPRLVITDALGRRTIPIERPITTFGRRSECDVRVTGADVRGPHGAGGPPLRGARAVGLRWDGGTAGWLGLPGGGCWRWVAGWPRWRWPGVDPTPAGRTRARAARPETSRRWHSGITNTARPGRSRPSASARAMTARAMRSFMLPVGLLPSILTKTSAPPGAVTLRSRTIGVWPIASRMSMDSSPPVAPLNPLDATTR